MNNSGRSELDEDYLLVMAVLEGSRREGDDYIRAKLALGRLHTHAMEGKGASQGTSIAAPQGNSVIGLDQRIGKPSDGGPVPEVSAVAAPEPSGEFVRVPKRATVQWSGRLKGKYPSYSNYELQNMINDVLAASPDEQKG